MKTGKPETNAPRTPPIRKKGSTLTIDEHQAEAAHLAKSIGQSTKQYLFQALRPLLEPTP